MGTILARWAGCTQTTSIAIAETGTTARLSANAARHSRARSRVLFGCGEGHRDQELLCVIALYRISQAPAAFKVADPNGWCRIVR